VYRGKLNLLFDLKTCFYLLQPQFTSIKLTTTLPYQLIIRLVSCTFILFSSGQFRIMGCCTNPDSILPMIELIYLDVHTNPHLVTQTLSFNICSTPINLYNMKQIYKDDCNVVFEPEIFCALSLLYWKPIHVNVFSTGKVVILGKDSMLYACTITKWIHANILSVL